MMNYEKNICENILKKFMGEKNTPASRMDMQGCGIRQHLWLRQVNGKDRTLWMPDAPYVLSAAGKREFFEILRCIKIPSCYVSNLHSRVTYGKLHRLKSHDYHILLHQILPVCLRNIGDEKVVGAVV